MKYFFSLSVLLLCTFFLSANLFSQTTTIQTTSKASPKLPSRITVSTFGASIVEGQGGSNFQEYIGKDLLQQQHIVSTVYNFGVSGETTAQGLARIEATVKNRSGFFLILMGTNDSWRIRDSIITLQSTLNNMSNIVAACLRQKLSVIVATLPYVNPTLGGTWHDVNPIIDRINTGYKRIVDSLHVAKCDVNATIGKNFNLLYDGLHPSDAGYRLIGQKWTDVIVSLLPADAYGSFSADEQQIQSYVPVTVPQDYILSQNYPNPFNPSTQISYGLPNTSNVRLTVYDRLGRVVSKLVDAIQGSGIYAVQFNATSLASGVYFYELRAGGLVQVKKMVLTK
jgi:acyl-CoA thioesterase-1